MPGGKTSFNKDWLKKIDKNKNAIGEWCKAVDGSQHMAFCIFCKTTIRCDNQGVGALLQHASGKTHQKIIKEVLSNSQTTLVFQNAASSSSALQPSTHSSSATVQQLQPTLTCVARNVQSTKAELIWAMKVVSSHYSYSSSDGIKEMFEAMFPGEVSKTFSMSAKKVSYIVSEAIGPYFHNRAIVDVLSSNLPYTLLYDEMTNQQSQKQLDIMIRYWSASHDEVRVHHLKTYLMGHATANQLSEKILSAIRDNKLPLERLMALGRDGPNVNKAVCNIINKYVLDVNKHGLVDIGSCYLHTVHNAFSKGLQCHGHNISDLVIDIYQWFKLSPARQEDYTALQAKQGVPMHKFLKHVPCRWLTLRSALNRLVEQWSTLCLYFVTELPKIDKSAEKNARYLRIKKVLQQKETIIDIHFLYSVSGVFSDFLENFQKCEPLIHLVYDEKLLLVKKVLGKFIKQEAFRDMKTFRTLSSLDLYSNQLNDDHIHVGKETRQALKLLPSDAAKKHCIMGMKTFLRKACEYLIKKNADCVQDLLKQLRCLNPSHRAAAWTIQAIKNVAKQLPVNVNSDVLVDEWLLYQTEEIPEDWHRDTKNTGESSQNIRIDHYWRKVLKVRNALGDLKYPNMTQVVKTALMLSHGNADVERGFSESGNSVTSQRSSLNEESINALRSANDGLKAFDKKVHLVPLTSDFIEKGRFAHSSYMRRIEEEKQRKEQAEKDSAARIAARKENERLQKELGRKNQQMKGEEEALSAREIAGRSEVEVGTALLQQGNEKLMIAMKEKDFKKVAVAQAIIETGQKKMANASKSLEDTKLKQMDVQKRKQALLDACLKAKRQRLLV